MSGAGSAPHRGGPVVTLLPGLGASLIAVFIATVFAALLPALPVLTVAVVLGILAGQLPGFRALLDGPLRPGIRFSAKTLMRAGIVLLGLKLSLGDIADLGWSRFSRSSPSSSSRSSPPGGSAG